MDNIERIQNIEKKNNTNKLELAKWQERKKTVDEELQKLLGILAEMKITESELQEKIATLELDINNQLDDIEKELNG